MYIIDKHNNNSYVVIVIINVFVFAKYKNVLSISYFTPKRKENSRCSSIYFYPTLCFIIINLTYYVIQ